LQFKYQILCENYDFCLLLTFIFFTFCLDAKSKKKIKPAKRDDYLRLMISLPKAGGHLSRLKSFSASLCCLKLPLALAF
jgi:hypothetical protein